MNTKTPEGLYRVVAVRDGQPTKRTILFPGPLTLKEAQTCKRSLTPYPWRMDLIEPMP